MGDRMEVDMKYRERGRAPRRAQLVAEAVAVLCPYCGEAQPAYGGSEFWTQEDFGKAHGIAECVSCEKRLLISTDSKVGFQ